MAKKPRAEKFQFRLTPEELHVLQAAAEKKDLSVSDFVRFVTLEMARAIVTDKSPEETYYAVIMAIGRVSPEIVAYSASADFQGLPKKETRKLETYETIDVEGVKDESENES